MFGACGGPGDTVEAMHLIELIDRSDLEALLETPAPETPLAVVRCASPPAAVEACERWAVRHVPAEARPADVTTVAPSGTAWTLGEVDELIVAPLRLTPRFRHVTIIADGDLMTATGWDHLLKTVEEPPSATLLWVVLPPDVPLPVTVQGRALLTVTLRLTPPERWHAALGASGMPAGMVERFVAHVEVLQALDVEKLAAVAARLDAEVVVSTAGVWATDVAGAIVAAAKSVPAHARRRVGAALWAVAVEVLTERCVAALQTGAPVAEVAEALAGISRVAVAAERNCGLRPHLVAAAAKTAAACSTLPAGTSR